MAYPIGHFFVAVTNMWDSENGGIRIENMNDIAEYIIDEKIDALLIDYNLASYATVPYTGVQLARYIQERFMEFPLFILTSYEDELYEQEVFDVYQIFDFERYLSEPQERVELHYKLIQQVVKYHKQLELWKKEIEVYCHRKVIQLR